MYLKNEGITYHRQLESSESISLYDQPLCPLLVFRILLTFLSPLITVNPQQYGNCDPHQDDEEEEPVSDIACAVCNDTDDQRTYEGGALRLLVSMGIARGKRKDAPYQ
jgi:hypothetical protein